LLSCAACLALASCTDITSAAVTKKAAGLPATDDHSTESQRLHYLREVFKKYPEIKLPFRYRTQTSETVTGIYTTDKDTLIFGEDNPVSIIGTIKDTSSYFGIFYLLPADDALPTLVTYDKKGKLIQRTVLAESCYGGCESDCYSIVTVDEKLLIGFDYAEFLYDCEGESHVPYQSSGYRALSGITREGRVRLIGTVAKDSAELRRTMILH